MTSEIINKIYGDILNIYPFLTKKEKSTYIKKSSFILKRQINSDEQIKKAIQDLLKLLKSGMHGMIWEWKRPGISRNFRKKRSHSFEIKNRVLFLTIPSWNRLLGNFSGKLIDICVKNIKNYDGIIIDVRENQGGASRIAEDFSGIFFKEDVEYGTIKRKNEKGKIFSSPTILRTNKNITINKPIVILISKLCYSSCESFLAPFKIVKRAILIGEQTGGGSANPKFIEVMIGGKKYVVRIPTWKFYLKGKKQPIEKTAIKPDIFYKGKNIEKLAVKIVKKPKSV